MSKFDMARGNIESQERGSGARADGGKPAWGLMPIGQVCYLMNRDTVMSWDPNTRVTLSCLVDKLGFFQMVGDYTSALDVLKWTMAYLIDRLGGAVVPAFEEVIGVWEHGEKKYAAFNWMKGMSWNSIIGCYMRHVMALLQGDFYDQESGRHHGAHLVCNAMMLLHYVEYYPQGNDLPTRWFSLEE